jgi:hypothetical protein
VKTPYLSQNIYGPSLKYFSSNQSPIIPIVDQRNILIQGNVIDSQENIVSHWIF